MTQHFRWLLPIMVLLSACSDPQSDLEAAPEPELANRIIALAPNLTELVFTAGAGDKLVGVVEFSDYPQDAVSIPRIGDAFRLDFEAIAALDPDLILAWGSGTPLATVERLQSLGYRVEQVEAERLDEIGEKLRAIGKLIGTEVTANRAADEYAAELQALRDTERNDVQVKVFYQVSAQPLFTMSDRHVVGEAIRLCGGENIFGDLAELSPAIAREAVIDAAPDLIVAGRFGDADQNETDALQGWLQWPSIPAVRRGQLAFVNADLLNRSTTRILGGVRELCARIEAARLAMARDSGVKHN